MTVAFPALISSAFAFASSSVSPSIPISASSSVIAFRGEADQGNTCARVAILDNRIIPLYRDLIRRGNLDAVLATDNKKGGKERDGLPRSRLFSMFFFVLNVFEFSLITSVAVFMLTPSKDRNPSESPHCFESKGRRTLNGRPYRVNAKLKSIGVGAMSFFSAASKATYTSSFLL